jgi:hypothetical protein
MTEPDNEPVTCPICGAIHDRHVRISNLRHERPKPGDITICIRCSGFLVFTDTLDLALPTEQQLTELQRDPYIWKVLRILAQTKAENKETKFVLKG